MVRSDEKRNTLPCRLNDQETEEESRAACGNPASVDCAACMHIAGSLRVRRGDINPKPELLAKILKKLSDQRGQFAQRDAKQPPEV